MKIGTLTVDIKADSAGLDDGVKKSKASLKTLNASAAESTKAFLGLDSAANKVRSALLGVVSARTLIAIKNATLEFQAIERTMNVATGSALAGGDAFRFLSSESERLGLNLRSSAGEFGKLAAAAKGTALEGQATRDIFTGVAEASTALGLTADKTAGALNAIQQMISKGTVAAEELRGQLGERLPGAFQLAAKAMGVTTAELGKMLENGEVLAEDLLPKLATVLTDRFGKAATEAAGGAQGAFNRLSNSVDMLMVSIGESGLIDAMAKFSNFIAQEVIPNLTYLGEKLGIIDTNFKNLKLGDAALRLYETDDAIKEVTESIERLERASGRNRSEESIARLNKELVELTDKKDKLQEVIDLINNPPALANIAPSGSEGGGLTKAEQKTMDAAKDAAQKALEALQARYATETELLTIKSEKDSTIIQDALANQLITKEEAWAAELEIKAAHEEALTAIEQDEISKRTELEQRHNDAVRSMREGALNQAVTLLSVLGQKSKTAAYAALALQKGLAIAETFASTQAASMRALAELGPIAGAPVAAAIETSGYTKMGLIAATGLAQAAGAGGGGSAGISAAATQGAQQSQTNGGQGGGNSTVIHLRGDNFSAASIVDMLNQAHLDGITLIRD